MIPKLSASAASSALEISPVREDQLKLGLWMFLATVTMLFAAFASAYVVRRSGSDWLHVPLPSILWWNTLVLAASSVAVEAANWLGRRKGLHCSSKASTLVGC